MATDKVYGCRRIPGQVAPAARGPGGRTVDGMDLSSLLRPRSIAVVGATPRTFVGHVALDNCRALGFGGVLTPVNGRYDEIAGLPAVAAVAELPAPPDVVVVQVATERVLGVVEESVAAGARNFVIPGGGFTDSGAAAKRLEAGLAPLAARHGIRVVGPNCMGVVDLVTGAAPYVGTVPEHVRRGRVAVLAQSGAVVEAVVNSGGRVPISTAVSTGSESATGMAEYLRFFAGDPATGAVIALVEGFTDPAGFLAAARRLAEAGKQLAVCLVGRTETSRAGVAAHSGKLAAPYRVATAALRQAGAVIAEDLDELLTFGEILGTGRRPAGRRVHIVTNSGGEGNLLADLAEDAGLELPPMSTSAAAALCERWPDFHVANPLDPWGVDDYPEVYPDALRAAAHEPGDVLVVSIDQQAWCGQYEKRLGRDLAGYLADAAAETGRMPVFLSPASQDPDPALADLCRARRIPLLRGARPALTALGRLAAAVPDPLAVPGPARRHHRLAAGTPLTEEVALDVLSSYGVRVPKRIPAGTPEEAADAAREIGGTVVLKAVAPGLLHKSDLGLVQVGLTDPDAVREAAEAILAKAGPDATLLVMEQVSGTLDVLLGYARDPQFGPTLLVGLGGVWAEELDDVAVHVGPLDREAALRLLDRSTVGRMLTRARGGALPADAVVDTLLALAELGSAHPEITSIDVNPLIIGPAGSWAVDAAIETVP